MKVKPFHSTRLGTKVYHNDSRCTEANNIEKRNHKSGTGALRQCRHCKRLK